MSNEAGCKNVCFTIWIAAGHARLVGEHAVLISVKTDIISEWVMPSALLWHQSKTQLDTEGNAQGAIGLDTVLIYFFYWQTDALSVAKKWTHHLLEIDSSHSQWGKMVYQ